MPKFHRSSLGMHTPNPSSVGQTHLTSELVSESATQTAELWDVISAMRPSIR